MCDLSTVDERFKRAIQLIENEKDTYEIYKLCRTLNRIYSKKGCGYTELNCGYKKPIWQKRVSKRISYKRQMGYDEPNVQLSAKKRRKTAIDLKNFVSHPRLYDDSKGANNPDPTKDNHPVKWGWIYLMDEINNKTQGNVKLIARFKPLLIKNTRGETVSFCGQITEPMPLLSNKIIHKLNFLDTLRLELREKEQQQVRIKNIYVPETQEKQLQKDIDKLKIDIEKIENLKKSKEVVDYNQKLKKWHDSFKGKGIELSENLNLEYPIVSKIPYKMSTFYVRSNCEVGEIVNMELADKFDWMKDNDPVKYITQPKHRPKFRAAKFNQVYDCAINQDGRIPNNKDIYEENLQSKIQNESGDIFVAAYGQSGSGKSYLIMGDEKQRGEKGLIEETLNDVMESGDVDKVLFLPLQIYMGHVYNAFIGPTGEENILKFYRGQVDIHGMPIGSNTSDIEKNYRLRDWNYVDIQDILSRDKNDYTYEHQTNNKDNNDKKNIRYPPVDIMLDKYFGLPATKIEDIDGINIMSLQVPKKNTIKTINNIIKNKIKRPVSKPDTNLNDVSSRSHLFNIIRVVFKDGTMRTLTFVDLGGLEPLISAPVGGQTILTKEQKFQKDERITLVTHDLAAFRKMFQFYTNHNDIIDNNKKNYKKSSSYIIGGVNSIIDSTTYQSSAIFNLVRATSGIFSNKSCTHYIFCLFHKFFETKNVYNPIKRKIIERNDEYIKCVTTNTVLDSVRGIIH